MEKLLKQQKDTPVRCWIASRRWLASGYSEIRDAFKKRNVISPSPRSYCTVRAILSCCVGVAAFVPEVPVPAAVTLMLVVPAGVDAVFEGAVGGVEPPPQLLRPTANIMASRSTAARLPRTLRRKVPDITISPAANGVKAHNSAFVLWSFL